MARYRLLISYDGTQYCGWQVQKNGIAVQGILHQILEKILQHPVGLTGSGRTDAGVHALGQVAHFDTDRDVDTRCLLLSLNGLLPDDIRVLEVELMDPEFHARYGAKRKIYHYHVNTKITQSPFLRLYSYKFYRPLDRALLEQAAEKLMGTHDFSTFANSPGAGGKKRNPVRCLDRITFCEEENGLRIEFEAPGFLYKMVRNLTGCLLDVGSGHHPLEWIDEMLAAKDRRQLGRAAPARGLFLVRVEY
jgi:tRNA pseudouridine38-40 synthase